MKLQEALELALSIKLQEARKKTKNDYSSLLNRFFVYWNELGNKDSLLTDFTKRDGISYLDYLVSNRKVGPVTRNNNLKVLKTLFYVLMEREYVLKNPFSGIKKLRTPKKRRRVFTPTETRVICNFLKGNDDGLLLAISLCYYCAIRPTELRRLRIEDIDLKKGLITLDGAMTKNKDLAKITMPKHLINYVKELRIHKHPSQYFVFGRSLLPNTKPCGHNAIHTRHKKVMTQLTQFRLLSDTKHKTFYSWKDTAARDMIEEGINAAALMKHFRHSSLETTQKYLESFGIKNDRIVEMKSKLF